MTRWSKSVRPRLGSLGPPTIRREVRRRFWRAIAAGLHTTAASVVAGVSQPAGQHWFVEAGGVPPLSLNEPSGRYLSFVEREEIAILFAQDAGVCEIARRLGRAPSTISRELRRNASTRSGRCEYRAVAAQWHAERRSCRPKTSKLAGDERLREYVQDKLSGPGRWSPEQIACRLEFDFPDDGSMRISHETIYRSLYVQGRGALRRELAACLRTGRAVRKPKRRENVRGKRSIPPEIMISERPAEVEDRAVPGHWEGDLIIGTRHSAIGTLVERKTRFVMLVPLPRLAGLIEGERGWTGRAAETVAAAITETITTLPHELRRTLTWDQGSEMYAHAQLKIDAELDVYFCDPRSPWQRGTNENTNGLLRQYFPKGTNLSVHSVEHLTEIAAALNGRPRKTLGWRTPAEALNEELRSLAS